MSDQGHVSTHGDDTPEGAVVESDLQPVSPEAPAVDDTFASRSPSEGLTEADVTARRAEEMAADEAPTMTDEQRAALPEDRPGEKDSVVHVAREVLDGKWGRGQERRMKLEDAGYDPAEVDQAVVELLNPEPEVDVDPAQDPETEVQEVPQPEADFNPLGETVTDRDPALDPRPQDH